MRFAWLLFASLLTSCSLSSSTAPPRVVCHGNADCRADQHCETPIGSDPSSNDGYCMAGSEGGFDVDGGMGADDMRGVQADMKDPYAWNPGQPRGPAAGCSSGQGWVLSAKLHACPGQCNSNMCPGLCAAGWSNPAILSIPEAACASVPWGFFASAAHGLDTGWPASSVMRCDWEAPNATWDQSLRLGCGPENRIYNGTLGPKMYTQAAPQKCGDFPVVARCAGLSGANTADTPFSCDPTGNPYKEAYYGPMNLGIRATPSDGVLCARP